MIECKYCGKQAINRYKLKLHQNSKMCSLYQKVQNLERTCESITNQSRIETDELQHMVKKLSSENIQLRDENKSLQDRNKDLERDVDTKIKEVDFFKEQFYALSEQRARIEERVFDQREKIEEKLLEKATTKTNNITTINQNIYNTLTPFDITDQKRIEKLNDFITDDDIKLGGITAVANRLCSHYITEDGNPLYAVSDHYRNTGVFIDTENNIVKDPGMNK